jgi:hypothetical protein
MDLWLVVDEKQGQYVNRYVAFKTQPLALKYAMAHGFVHDIAFPYDDTPGAMNRYQNGHVDIGILRLSPSKR